MGPEIVDHAQHTGRNLDDDGLFRNIDVAREVVDDPGIGRHQNVVSLQQLVPLVDGALIATHARKTFLQSQVVEIRIAPNVELHGSLVVVLVEHGLGGFIGRVTADIFRFKIFG